MTIILALALAQVSGNWRTNEVETRYRAALAATTSCQKAQAYRAVNDIKPIAEPNNAEVVEQIAAKVRQGCDAEKSAYLQAVGAKVALNNPSGRKRQQEIVSGVTAQADALMDRMARGWSIAALKNDGTPPPEPTNTPVPKAERAQD